MAKHDEASVIRSLARNKDVYVDNVRRVIRVTFGTARVGNGTWGKIDYLTHYCGYTAGFTTVTAKTAEVAVREEGNADIKFKHKEKKEKSIVLAKDVKNVFKKKIKLKK